MSKQNTFSDGVSYLCQRMSQLPDIRSGNNCFISMRDIGLSAFSVFFMQSASFLQHQQLMQKRTGKDNARSLFNIEHIPSDNHVRKILDQVPPSEIFPVFDFLLNKADKAGELDSYRYLNKKFLMPMDGVHYFSSQKIHCPQCSVKKRKDDSVHYSHSMVSAIFVHPNKRQVLPLPPEFIEPQDGTSKQNCELNAAKRWLQIHGKKYATMGVIMLGDDLYCHQPFCRAVLDAKYDFIFVCKPDSHRFLFGNLEGLEKLKAISEITFKENKQVWCCRYVNNIELKDDKDALLVNWCEVAVYNKDDKRVYFNTFATNIEINDQNIAQIVKAGRERWKTENELNNNLKNHGYFLEHNFGHGQNFLSSLLATMILLAFLFHTLLFLTDKRYRAIRSNLPRKVFFQHIRTLVRYMYFASWLSMMEFMVTEGEFSIDSS